MDSIILFSVVIVAVLSIILLVKTLGKWYIEVRSKSLTAELQDSNELQHITKITVPVLRHNEAYVIKGTIPYKYLYWSINSEKTSVSSRTVAGNNNDQVVVIITKNLWLFKAINRHFLNEWEESKSIYKLHVHPIFTDNTDIFTTILKRYPEDYVPDWEYESIKVKNSKYIEAPEEVDREVTNGKEQEFEDIKGSIETYLFNSSGESYNCEAAPQVEKNDDRIIFGMQVNSLGNPKLVTINHTRSHSAKASLFEYSGGLTITGDPEVVGTSEESSLMLRIFDGVHGDGTETVYGYKHTITPFFICEY